VRRDRAVRGHARQSDDHHRDAADERATADAERELGTERVADVRGREAKRGDRDAAGGRLGSADHREGRQHGAALLAVVEDDRHDLVATTVREPHHVLAWIGVVRPAVVEPRHDERIVHVHGGVGEIGAGLVTCNEGDRRLLGVELVREARAIALHQVRTCRLRARHEQLAGERQLAGIACVLTLAVGVDAGLFGHRVGGRGRAGEHERPCEHVTDRVGDHRLS
jgi:hypothetical protein